MPTSGFVDWFRNAEKIEKNKLRRAPMKAKELDKRRKRNKQARASRKKNR